MRAFLNRKVSGRLRHALSASLGVKARPPIGGQEPYQSTEPGEGSPVEIRKREMMEAWEFASLAVGRIRQPIGSVVTYTGPVEEHASPPGPHRQWLRRCGWLVCDGSALPTYNPDRSRSEYWQLFMAIGTAYGGDNDTFQLPDYWSYFFRGLDMDMDSGNVSPLATTITHGIDQREPGAWVGRTYRENRPNTAAPYLLIKFTDLVGKPESPISHLLEMVSAPPPRMEPLQAPRLQREERNG
jgi:hypothetical protein